MTEKEKSLWDQAVVEYELSGLVTPKGSHARQYECDPIEWAGRFVVLLCYRRFDFLHRYGTVRASGVFPIGAPVARLVVLE